MSITRYCYHCGKSHPEEEMRQVVSKAGKRWRCIASIEATKKSTAERDKFGQMVTAANSKTLSIKQKARNGL